MASKKRKSKKPTLRRVVDLFMLTMYGVGVIIGAGIYSLIGKSAGMTGNSLWMSFLIAAVVSAFTGLSYAELVSLFPKSAAEYTYVKKSLKSKMFAFSVGWITIAANAIAASVVALGFAGYLHALTGLPILASALVLIAILSFVNFFGIGESMKLNILFAFVEMLGLVLVILFAIPHLGSVNYFEMPNGFTGVLSASALIFFAFIGFEEIVNIAEETKNPRKVSPKALILSIAITAIIYMLISVSAVSLADWRDLAASAAPLALAASKEFGQSAFLLLSITALFATTNTVLILLIVGSRDIYGMSNDGVLPRFLSKVHATRRTPWVAALVVMFIAMAFVFMENIKTVASITDFATFVVYFFVNASVLILRFTMPNLKRSFRTPVNIGNFPVLSFIGLFTIGALAANLDPITILIGFGIFLSAFPIYYVFRKKSIINI